MATPLPVTGVEALTDGLKLDITTTISKDAAGNLSFSSDSDGGSEDDGEFQGIPIYAGSAFASFTGDGVDIALKYIVQIDDSDVGAGFLIPVTPSGDSNCQLIASCVISSGLMMPDHNSFHMILKPFNQGPDGGEEDHDHGMPIFNLSTNEYGTHPEGTFVVQMIDGGLFYKKLSGQIMSG